MTNRPLYKCKFRHPGVPSDPVRRECKRASGLMYVRTECRVCQALAVEKRAIKRRAAPEQPLKPLARPYGLLLLPRLLWTPPERMSA